jgi:hypothetical protein
MPTMMLGIFNNSNSDVAVGPPSHLVGNAMIPVAPDPVLAGSAAAGLYDNGVGADLELTLDPTIAPNVVLFIDIWIQRTKFEKLIVTSSDDANYPISGKWEDQGHGNFFCSITIG